MTPTDHELVKQALAGSDPAYSELDRRWRPRLLAFVGRSVNDRDQAADLVQVTLTKAFLKLHTFNQGAAWSTWLYTIARNVLASHFKRKRLEVRVDPELLDVVDLRAPADEALLATEAQRAAAKAFAALTPAQQRVFELAVVQEKSYTDICRELRLPEGTMKSQLHRARTAFAAAYKEAA